MPRKSSSLAKAPRVSGDASTATDPLRVLLVDAESHVRDLLCETIQSPEVCVVPAESVADARAQLARHPVDLALIDPKLPDGSGLDLVRELSGSGSMTRTILIPDSITIDQAVSAIRAGVTDLVCKPLDLNELNERLAAAIKLHKADRQREDRARKLRKLCRKLDQARQEVTEQVDVLCNDLVVAYQELANQMQQVVQTSEFAGLVRDELDLEGLLRKTLEYVVQKAGPVNAALYLPSTADEYALGGYVNYDCTSDSADLLLQHLCDVVAPRMTQQNTPVHITDNETLARWLGDDQAYLVDSHLFAFTARHDGEALAVVMLFRDGSMPFSQELVESLTAIAPLLGDYLARIIRVHHRHCHDLETGSGEIPF